MKFDTKTISELRAVAEVACEYEVCAGQDLDFVEAFTPATVLAMLAEIEELLQCEEESEDKCIEHARESKQAYQDAEELAEELAEARAEIERLRSFIAYTDWNSETFPARQRHFRAACASVSEASKELAESNAEIERLKAENLARETRISNDTLRMDELRADVVLWREEAMK